MTEKGAVAVVLLRTGHAALDGGLVRWTYGPEGDASRVTGQREVMVADGGIVAIYAFLDNPEITPEVPESTLPGE